MTGTFFTLVRTVRFLGLRNLGLYLILLVALPALVDLSRQATRLSQHGVDATGQVLATTLSTSTGRWGQTVRHYRVEYRFQTADGTFVDGAQRLSHHRWDRARQDGVVPVRYVADDPRLNATFPPEPLVMLAMLMITTALGLWATVRGVTAYRTAQDIQRLLIQPIWRRAEVTGIVREPWLHGRGRRLEWRDTTGQTGRSLVALRGWRNPGKGDLINVLVDPWGGRNRWERDI